MVDRPAVPTDSAYSTAHSAAFGRTVRQERLAVRHHRAWACRWVIRRHCRRDRQLQTTIGQLVPSKFCNYDGNTDGKAVAGWNTTGGKGDTIGAEGTR